MTRIAAFTPARGKQINDAITLLERNGYFVKRGRTRGYRQPVDAGIEFQVESGINLQYRVNGGSWTTIATLRQRVQGSAVQHSLEPAGSTYVDWDTVTDCPT